MATYRPKKGRLLALGTALAALVVAGPVSAQDVDARWLPWLGCWQPASAEMGAEDLLCVRPSDDPLTVEIVRVVESEVVARELVWADGARHETAREGCDGWEEGSFSADGRRVFLRSEHVCEGGAEQDGAGILAMATPEEWLDIRVAGLGGERMTWVQRYVQADAGAVAEAGLEDPLADRDWTGRSARFLAAAALDVDDVIEASGMVPAEAVEALLAERGDRLALQAADLVRLADAGVSEEIIDVAVAVSYPERFAVASDPSRGGGYRGARGMYGYMGPYFYDPFLSPWGFRYGYGYGYGAYGYPYYGSWGYGGWGYRPTVVVVDPAPRTHGRVVNGRGYTRSRTSGVGTSRSWVPRRSGASSSSGQIGTGSTARSSGAASSGRKAKRRGG